MKKEKPKYYPCMICGKDAIFAQVRAIFAHTGYNWI